MNPCFLKGRVKRNRGAEVTFFFSLMLETDEGVIVKLPGLAMQLKAIPFTICDSKIIFIFASIRLRNAFYAIFG